MIQLLFVNDLPDDNTRSQLCRSHAARVDYQRRRQKTKSLSSTQVPSAHGYINYPYLLSTNRPDRHSNRALQTAPLSIVTEPACPLMLGPFAASAASLHGHEYINFYISRAKSKCSYVYPAFNMSSIHSLDWAEYVSHYLTYHAAAAYVQFLHDGVDAPSRTTLKHRGKAIEAIRKHLSHVDGVEYKVSLHAIAAVVLLAVLDEKLGDMTSHRLHRRMLGVLMNSKGSLDDLEYHPLYSTISEVEMDWTLRTGYSVIKYRPTPRQRTTLTKSCAQVWDSKPGSLPVGFEVLVAAGEISAEVAETVTHVAETMQGKRQEHHRQNPLRRFHYYFQAFPYLFPDYPNDLTLDDLLELAILLFCSHTITPSDPGVLTKFISRKKLAEDLPLYLSRNRNPSSSEMGTLLWIWILTLHAWEQPQKDIQCDQVTALLQDLPFANLAMLDEDGIEDLLRGYFWTEDFLIFGRNRWQSLCNPATKGR